MSWVGRDMRRRRQIGNRDAQPFTDYATEGLDDEVFHRASTASVNCDVEDRDRIQGVLQLESAAA